MHLPLLGRLDHAFRTRQNFTEWPSGQFSAGERHRVGASDRPDAELRTICRNDAGQLGEHRLQSRRDRSLLGKNLRPAIDHLVGVEVIACDRVGSGWRG